MAMNLNLTTSSDISAGQQTYYDKRMLDYAKPNLVHAQFATKKNVPKNSGKVVNWRRWVPFATLITPLTEGTVPDGQTLVEESVSCTLYQYGGYVSISDFLELTHLDVKISEAVEVLGDQGGRSIDEVVRNVMITSATAQYANSKTSIYTLAATDTMTVTELRKAVRTLKNNLAPMFVSNGSKHYVAIVDPYTTYDLQADSAWVNVSTYSDKEQIYSGELGRLFGVRFVETTVAKTYDNVDLISGATSLTAASLSTATVTIDEALTTAQASALVGRYVNIVDASVTAGTTYERQLITAAAAGTAGAATVTLDAAPAGFTLADGDILYANEYGLYGNSVHATLIFGKNAYAIADIEGSRGLRSIIKDKRSGGPSNPLEQFSTIAWKVEAMGCAVLEDAWILKVLHGASGS